MNPKTHGFNPISSGAPWGAVLVLFLAAAAPAFSNYTDQRRQAKTEAIPKPVPGFKAADYPGPAGGFIVETRDLSKLHPGRGLVLWMKNVVRTEAAEYGDCPSWVTGSNYSGLIYASLLDVANDKVLQTVFFDMSDEEGDSLPFRIIPGLYSVHGKPNALNESEPVLLEPVVIDKDPACEEYVFFENPGGCFCPVAFPFGYDSAADKIFRFKEVGYGAGEDAGKRWESEAMSDLFFEIDRAPGRKSYEFYSSVGHGSEVFTLQRYEYDRKLRTFYGVLVDVPDDDQHDDLYLDKSGKLKPAAHHYLDNIWKEIKPRPDGENQPGETH